MNTETQTPRLESGKVRIIDANALISHLQGLFDGKIVDYDGFKCNKYEC